MNRLVTCSALLMVVAVALPGCVDSEATQATPPPGSLPSEDTAQRQEFETRLLEIAASYESYGRIDPAARWAPVDCADPLPQAPEALVSRSTDADTHGRKLYWLFAKLHNVSGSYAMKEGTSPVGQVVVKESWVPEEVSPDTTLTPLTRKAKVRVGDRLVEQEDSFLPYARQGGKLYHAKERGPLFVMFKVDPQTPGTDEGWVYGTVKDGKEVTSAGRVESCMKCHQDAPHDRLFGLPEP
jgi:hypothetical protein